MGIRRKIFFNPIMGLALATAVGLLLTPELLVAEGLAETVCIQTFNAYGPAYSSNLRERTKVMGEEMAAVPCQIVQLQEVWTPSHHQWAIDALGSSIPSLSATRFDDFKRPSGGQSGLSIFTSEILTDQTFEQFTVNQDGLLDDIRDLMGVIKGIGSSTVTLRNNSKHSVHMLNVHLHPTSVRVRIDQIVQLLDKMERLMPLKHPVVLTGDFNFTPDTVEYAILKDVARLTDSYALSNGGYHPDTCTYCVDNPNHWSGTDGVIDYIWTRPGATESITPTHTYINMMGLQDVAPSDHYGVRSNMILRDATIEFVNNAEYAARLQAATKAIIRALHKLDDAGSDDQPFVATRQKLTSLLNRLRTGNPDQDAILGNLAIK